MLFRSSDAETGEEIVIENFDRDYHIEEELPKNILTLYTDENYIIKLANYFKRRRRV